ANALRTLADGPRRSRSTQPPGEQLVGDDAPGVRRHPGAQGMAAPRRGSGGSADAPGRTVTRPPAHHAPARGPASGAAGWRVDRTGADQCARNALRYTPPGSPLSLAAWPTNGAVTVEVADQGPGLPLGEEQRVFDKFYRAQQPGTSSGAGLGLT